MPVGFFQENLLTFSSIIGGITEQWISLPQKHFSYKELHAEMGMKIISPAVGKRRMECPKSCSSNPKELGFVPLELARALGTIQWDGLRGNCWHPYLKNNSVLPN